MRRRRVQETAWWCRCWDSLISSSGILRFLGFTRLKGFGDISLQNPQCSGWEGYNNTPSTRSAMYDVRSVFLSPPYCINKMRTTSLRTIAPRHQKKTHKHYSISFLPTPPLLYNSASSRVTLKPFHPEKRTPILLQRTLQFSSMLTSMKRIMTKKVGMILRVSAGFGRHGQSSNIWWFTLSLQD